MTVQTHTFGQLVKLALVDGPRNQAPNAYEQGVAGRLLATGAPLVLGGVGGGFLRGAATGALFDGVQSAASGGDVLGGAAAGAAVGGVFGAAGHGFMRGASALGNTGWGSRLAAGARGLFSGGSTASGAVTAPRFSKLRQAAATAGGAAIPAGIGALSDPDNPGRGATVGLAGAAVGVGLGGGAVAAGRRLGRVTPRLSARVAGSPMLRNGLSGAVGTVGMAGGIGAVNKAVYGGDNPLPITGYEHSYSQRATVPVYDTSSLWRRR